MNLSFSSLSCISLINSPFFTNPITREKKEIIFKKCHFSNFLNSFLYSNSNTGKISIYKSKINNILNNALYIEQISDENIQFSKHSRNSFTDRLFLVVSKTVFSKCVSDKRGGALFVQHDFCTFGLFNSAFYDCSSYFTNGALFFRGRSSSASQNCFDTCVGRQASTFSSQAFFFSTRNGFNNAFNETSVVSSSPFAVRGRDGPGVFWKGNLIVTHVNSSYNHIIGKTCGINIANIENSYIRFNTFSNSTGFSVLNLQSFRSSEELAYLNFVQNEAFDHGSIFFLYDTNAIICNSIFIKNIGKLVAAAGNWKLQFDSCVSDSSFEESIFVAKNIITFRCSFGISTNIKTHQIKSVSSLLCYTDCGDNEKCAQNIVDYKEPNLVEYGFPNIE